MMALIPMTMARLVARAGVNRLDHAWLRRLLSREVASFVKGTPWRGFWHFGAALLAASARATQVAIATLVMILATGVSIKIGGWPDHSWLISARPWRIEASPR